MQWGETVTLTVEPAAGYELDTLTVTPDDATIVADVTTDNTFTMPDSDVTVMAIFKHVEPIVPDDPTDPDDSASDVASPEKAPTLADTVVLPEIDTMDNIIYDDFIGTGDGLGQLSIVFDGGYAPADYELLNVFI